YGFEPVRLEGLEWDEVVVPPATPLVKIANSVGITLPELKELNPHFRIHRTP
ncbi:MAG: lytic transglycosylase, partial [Gemmatimonadetes bacterium]|nr:lytic transglycosylase [Gemmatimonadota bacterium]NIT88800.1 lytic transglycosylase [Gemmatimonadota bacterium]NIU77902.1 lytic transglycosylase [Gammaproteobacteria bacterium]NIX41006.1 lytic transglycosylase [Gemmatimonadota bacterium]NIY40696.1 lytic transglycosylase [Gemmatimonadota bacterium]